MKEVLPRPFVALLARWAFRLGFRPGWVLWYVETADRERVRAIAAATEISFASVPKRQRHLH